MSRSATAAPGTQADRAEPSAVRRLKEDASVFTGLVEVLGQVERVLDENSGKRFVLIWPGLDSSPGDR